MSWVRLELLVYFSMRLPIVECDLQNAAEHYGKMRESRFSMTKTDLDQVPNKSSITKDRVGDWNGQMFQKMT
jgi:hypothetical protein